MTKTEKRDVDMAYQACRLGMHDMAARIMSAAVRACLRKKSQIELEAHAALMGVRNHPDYIIC